jgi:hypothetical protein
MVGTHGGTIVPPRDGDGISSEDEDGLVAQIIPLRQREQGSGEDFQVPETLDDSLPPAGDEPLSERSVWEQPTAELLRRRTEAASRVPPANQARTIASRFSRRVVAVVALAVIAAAVLGVALAGNLGGHPRSAPRRLDSSKPKTSSISKSSVDRSPARRSTYRHRPRAGHEAPRSSSTPITLRSASESQVAGSTTGAPVKTSSSPATVVSPVAPEHGSSESTPPQTQPTHAPRVSKPSTSEKPCVPGELGC